ncbi:hypothetical protein [Desulfoferrobacter suflitae]|uniref:hypothetical protein n=1 Tax=Desulfoferrobacter suflitae TaxID=2865782 RepID=UPI00216494BB|nr:hypothetical protein [Desulfoferrobacter suflitae]MCK8604343.1 hypothetical protein [Desulfoferrobacter suflitae]
MRIIYHKWASGVLLLLAVLPASGQYASFCLCAASQTSAPLAHAASLPAARACPPLAPAAGDTVQVATVQQLLNAVNDAAPGATILIADGIYNLNGACLSIITPGVTLRSSSGDREAVVLDGNYITTEIVQILASNVTLGDLTLREAAAHPIHVMSSDGAHTLNTAIYNVHIVDPGEQAIKINPAAAGSYTDDGLIACSHIELTAAGRLHVNDCYTGGVDAHQARNWIVRDNLIEGFWCASGLSEHAIHFWRSSRDTVVERNVLRNNARGIGFGLVTSGDGSIRTYPDNPCPAAGGAYVDHYGGIIRNNFVFAGDSALFASEDGFDSGISLWQACGVRVMHNTVASTRAPSASSIEWRFPLTDVDLINNLVTHDLWERDNATASLAGNLQHQPLALFVNGAGGDLHLAASAAAAIDQVAAPADASGDIDCHLRPLGEASDIGADEYRADADKVWSPSLLILLID